MIFGFLRLEDFYSLIQSDKLNVVTDSDNTIIEDVYHSSFEELASYIRHRYDIQRGLKSILSYSVNTYYNIGDLVEWTETAYSASSTYNTGDKVSYNGYIYSAKEDGITGAFDSAKWTQLAENNKLFYCNIKNQNQLPSTSFAYSDGNTQYTGGYDLITGWDRLNVTLYMIRDDDTIYIYSSSADRTNKNNPIGMFEYSAEGLDLPLNCEIKNTGSSVSVLSGNIQLVGYIADGATWDVSASNYWVLGDNRNGAIKQRLVDIILYHLHSRIQPRNIPEIRIQRYDGGTENRTAGAIGYLKDVQKGRVMLDLPLYQNKDRGHEWAYGSEPKLTWDY